jgi:hypothetical protein
MFPDPEKLAHCERYESGEGVTQDFGPPIF